MSTENLNIKLVQARAKFSEHQGSLVSYSPSLYSKFTESHGHIADIRRQQKAISAELKLMLDSSDKNKD
ncbi:MAG: hypothetical protein PHY16_16520 [Methylobacter sp.]|nr:hypothetical protein [Methylobacter sp.]